MFLKEKSTMGKHSQVTCKIYFMSMRSDNIERYMKVHDKYILKILLKTNEEICKDLVMGLVDNADLGFQNIQL